MTEKEKLLEQKEEAMARLACLDYEENTGGLPDCPEWDEFEKVLAEAAVPTEMAWDGKVKRALRNHRLEKASGAVRRHSRVTIIAATLMVCLAGITYARNQEAIHNFIMTITDRYFTIGGESVDENKYFDLTDMYVPQYIPTGFHLIKQTKTANYIALEYQGNTELERICFQQTLGSAGLVLDTTTDIRSADINGVSGQIFLNSEGDTMIYWGEGRQFLIRGTADSAELLAMADSVVFVP